MEIRIVLPYLEGLKCYARELRTNMTDAEIILWSQIRRKQILGVRFYRQKPIGPYILDFYANFPKIAIEIDGNYHYLPEQEEKDNIRDLYLRSLEILVLRFDNQVVLQNPKKVLSVISNTIRKIHPPAR